MESFENEKKKLAFLWAGKLSDENGGIGLQPLFAGEKELGGGCGGGDGVDVHMPGDAGGGDHLDIGPDGYCDAEAGGPRGAPGGAHVLALCELPLLP